MNTIATKTTTELTADCAAFIVGLSDAQRAAWNALAAEEAAAQAAYAEARVQQHLTVYARIGRDTVRLADETIAPACITRRDCREVALAHGASKLVIRDVTFARTPGNAFGDAPEPCLHDVEYRYVVDTDTLTIYEHGRLIYINQSGHILHGEDLDRLYLETELAA